MEKSNFTLSGTFKIISSFSFLMLFVLSQNIYAQCSLGVNTNTQISLDANCEATITYDMVLNDQTTTCPDGVFMVNVQTLDQVNIIGSPIVSSAYVNQTLIAQVVDMVSGNTGWGYIHIEDKLAPVITCVDVTVSCFDISSFAPTVIDACDPNPTYVLLTQSEDVLDCDDDYIKVITREYQAMDADGNVSAPCTQSITVERIDFMDITFPEDVSEGNMNAIPCDFDYPTDDEGNPSPLGIDGTGVPTLFTDSGLVDIFPTSDLSCNTIVSYNDVVLPSIGGVQKIMREWIVNEWWCSGSNTIMDIQVIEITDSEGPEFASCPDSYTVSTTAGTDCEAIVLLTLPATADACGIVSRVDLTYGTTFINDFQGGLVFLPIGYNEITYTAYDNNLNASTCVFTITVSDQTAPVVVCDQNTVVSLSIDGTALVYAYSFDDGSYDDCTDVTYEVRRMDNPECPGFDGTAYANTVPFYCCDIGNTVQVQLRVTDAQGNSNNCMVNVTVQDKLPPAIVCPENMSVDCDFVYDAENLAATFGSATAMDNCGFDISETASININDCNEGTITRYFTATDPNGSATCSQTITFTNNEPFDQYDIQWPGNVVITECVDPSSLGPDATGYPILTEDACDKVGFDYSDKTFTIINGDNACFKIIRTWEVLDWCQSNNNNNFVTFTYQQTIKVINTEAPAFTGDYSDLVECTYDAECDSGFITLKADAADACTDELVWVYRIDLDNDGTFNYTSNAILADSIDASGTYALGNHRVVFTAEDGCGNSVSQTQLFSIVNCKTPTPYCHNGLAIELMPIDTDGDGVEDFGQVATWASDFDAGSFHSCDLPVTVSFSADPLDTGRVYTCNELGENIVQIWAHAVLPNGDVLSDYCTATLDIQANNGICGDDPNPNPLVVIEGDIETEMDDKSDNVIVALNGSDLSTATNEMGVYAFNAMPMGGTYELVPTKIEDNKLNGITTLDIVFIQKHILGIQVLGSPYKMIAADVNNDENINGVDIINLRKLLLGVYGEFPSNKDWKFVDASYNFLNPASPLTENYPQTYMINELTDNMDVDFVSVKIGDVNNTASANLTSDNSETRSNETFEMTVTDTDFTSGEEVRMEVKATDVNNVYGMQYTLQFNDMSLEYAGVESGAFNVSESGNLGLNTVDQGIISVSMSNGQMTRLAQDDVLFTMIFTAKTNGQLSGNVSINSEVTSEEAYNESLEIMDIALNFRNDNGDEVVSTPFTLYQNVPNPFTSTTNISFNLPKSTSVTVSVFDVAGKMIHTQTGAYATGMNMVELDVTSMNASGVLYYQVETKEHTATRKMVVLK